MKLIFVRHGKDDENFRGGWSNLGLVPEGVEQAKRLATLLKEKKEEYGIKKILSSDLVRAKETAEILAEALKLPLQADERLREVDNGDLAGMPNAEALEKYPGVFWSTLKPDECYPNGESPMQFFSRIKEWFETFLKECKEADGNVQVTHGGVINVVYHLVWNLEWSNAEKPVLVGNCSAHVMDVERMEIGEENMFEELRYEEMTDTHLDELAQLYVDTFNAAPWNDEWTFETARKRLQQLLHSEDFYHKQGMGTDSDMVFMSKRIGD